MMPSFRGSSISMRFATITEALCAAPAGNTFVTHWAGDDAVMEVTFEAFVELSRSQASGLWKCGVRAGERVVLVMPQGIPLMATFVGAMLLGAVPAILPYPNRKVEPAKYRSGLAGVSKNLRARLTVVDDEFPQELATELLVSDEANLVRDSEVSLASSSDIPAYAPAPDDLAFIQHSAGTTGLQKGVALTHRAVLTQLEHLARSIDLRSSDRIYSWLPLYHDMGLVACFMLPLVWHLPVVMQSPIDWVMQPASMLELVSRRRCTLAWLPNFALSFLSRRVREQDREGLDLSCVRALINCSEPVRAHSMDEFAATYEPYGFRPNALATSYAMAENVFAVTQSAIGESPVRVTVDRTGLLERHVAVPSDSADSVCLVSSGRCLPSNEVRIVSPEGRDLADGAVGEIVVRSDSLFQGYYNRPDLTQAAIKDGWYWTGDLGFRDGGELFVSGRRKDLIIVAGKNLYPQDVEEIVARHPAVHDGRVVAFGLYSEAEGTEEIVVVAELHQEQDADACLAIEMAARSAIATELGVTPRVVILKPPAWIVKSTAGKPARSTTRAKLLTEHPELGGDGSRG